MHTLWVSGTHLPCLPVLHGWPPSHCHLLTLAPVLTRPTSPFPRQLSLPLYCLLEENFLFSFRDSLLPRNPSWWVETHYTALIASNSQSSFCLSLRCTLCLRNAFALLGSPGSDRSQWSPFPVSRSLPLASSIYRQTSLPHSSLRPIENDYSTDICPVLSMGQTLCSFTC